MIVCGLARPDAHQHLGLAVATRLDPAARIDGHDRRVRGRPAHFLRQVAHGPVAVIAGRDQLRRGPAAVQDRAGRLDRSAGPGPAPPPAPRLSRDRSQKVRTIVRRARRQDHGHDLLRIRTVPTYVSRCARDRGSIIVISDRDSVSQTPG